MNTLSFPLLREKIAASSPVREILKAANAGKFPLEIEASEGALTGILLSLLYRELRGRFLAVVSSDLEAARLARDLETAGVPAAVFPWWGTMPYRDMAPLSAVFGERVGLLANLAAGQQGIVIASQRAFLSPLPPPDYL
ncbi:MAG: transcription-repair coupling factor, partial [Treponema sp.]|nr:transcription-repair coupling factor [Treponema sp.]